MIRTYSLWKWKIKPLKILEYLHLSFIKWPQYKFSINSINSWYFLFFETTIMGKTADFTEPRRREASGSKCKLLLVNSQNTGRVKQQQTGRVWARHQSNPRASVDLRSANNIQIEYKNTFWAQRKWLCSEDKGRSNRFGTAWGWVINESEWTIPLHTHKEIYLHFAKKKLFYWK